MKTLGIVCLTANNLVFVGPVSSCFVSRSKHSFQYKLNSVTTADQGRSPVYLSTWMHCLRSVSYSQAWTYWLPFLCWYFEQKAKGCESADHSRSALRSVCLWNCRTDLLELGLAHGYGTASRRCTVNGNAGSVLSSAPVPLASAWAHSSFTSVLFCHLNGKLFMAVAPTMYLCVSLDPGCVQYLYYIYISYMVL